VTCDRLTSAQIRNIAEKLEALDNGLYNDVLALLAESRCLAVEEYKRGVALLFADPAKSKQDKRQINAAPDSSRGNVPLPLASARRSK
jgi:hypothetical protein